MPKFKASRSKLYKLSTAIYAKCKLNAVERGRQAYHNKGKMPPTVLMDCLGKNYEFIGYRDAALGTDETTKIMKENQ